MKCNATEKAPAALRTLRTAIYTRVATAESVERGKALVDEQRLMVEQHLAAQAPGEFEVLPARYDDVAVSGATMDLPGLQQLIRDVEAGQIDCVAVSDTDRLPRGMRDLHALVALFDQHGVKINSATGNPDVNVARMLAVLEVLLADRSE